MDRILDKTFMSADLSRAQPDSEQRRDRQRVSLHSRKHSAADAEWAPLAPPPRITWGLANHQEQVALP